MDSERTRTADFVGELPARSERRLVIRTGSWARAIGTWLAIRDGPAPGSSGEGMTGRVAGVTIALARCDEPFDWFMFRVVYFQRGALWLRHGRVAEGAPRGGRR
jgi:hypothetical protein